MARRRPLLLCALLFACGPSADPTTPLPTSELACADQADDDRDGLTDCDDDDCAAASACWPTAPKACTRQLDCGDVKLQTRPKCCLPKPPASPEPAGELRCFAPGPTDEKGDALLSEVAFTLAFDDSYAQSGARPRTAVVRLVYPKRVDGSALGCAQLSAINGATPDTRGLLDADPTLNQAFRSIYQLDWSSGTTTFRNLTARAPRGESFLLYGEIWYGPQQLNEPTGNRAVTFCREGVSVTETPVVGDFEMSFQPAG